MGKLLLATIFTAVEGLCVWVFMDCAGFDMNNYMWVFTMTMFGSVLILIIVFEIVLRIVFGDSNA